MIPYLKLFCLIYFILGSLCILLFISVVRTSKNLNTDIDLSVLIMYFSFYIFSAFVTFGY